MLVNATTLMFAVFQSCRHARPHTGEALNVLAETLEMINHQRTFVIKVPDSWVEQHGLQKYVVTSFSRPLPNGKLSPANQELFSLVCLGAEELARLWAADSIDALQFLGYAFHNVPRLIGAPEAFRPSWFFANMTRHWDDYSIEMRQAVCAMMHIDLQQAATLIKTVTASSRRE